MEKPIETIWKEGFLRADAPVAPRINNLYDMKSQNLFARFQRKARINLIVIAVAVVVSLLLAISLNVLLPGIIFALLLLSTGVVGWYFFNKLEAIDQGETSYDYLRAFDAKLKQIMRFFARFYRFIYPAFMLVGIWIFYTTEPGQEAWQKLVSDPDAIKLLGIPLWVLIPALLMTALIFIGSGYLYQMDMRLAYGKELRKLQELIDDMEELRD